MTYEQMMEIGKSCGLTTVKECYDNILIHYDVFFTIEEANKELLKLREDIHKKNSQEFIKIFSILK